MAASSSSAVTLRIVQITDVYKLDNFPSLRTLINDKRQQLEELRGGQENARLISVLTGDFLAPYLLSALDQGRGMIRMLNECPIDLLTFGNHEDDIAHSDLVQRASEYRGVWINSNMQDHEAFRKGYQVATHTIEIGPETHRRKIGFVAVVADSPGLYRKNAFNGAKIESPWETLRFYKDKLEREEGVDLVIPLCHLYVPDDKITCKMFDFPVIFSGHDHHVVNEVFDGTLLLKSGADARNAVVLDITWLSASAQKPELAVEVVNVADWPRDDGLVKVLNNAALVLDHLRHTELAAIPERYRPLSSLHSRGEPSSMARFLWSCLRAQINIEAGTQSAVDAVLISGGDLRGDRVYPDDSTFTLEDLNNEISGKLEYIIAKMPGRLISEGVQLARSCGPNPGWTQLDEGVLVDESGAVTHVAGAPIEPDRLYNVVITRWDAKSGPVRPWLEYYAAHPDHLSEDEWEAQVTLLAHFAQHVWKRLWDHLDTNHDGKLAREELLVLDTDGDGRIGRSEIAHALRHLGIDVDDEEMSFIDCILDAAGDRNHDGYLSEEEIANLNPPRV